MVVKKELEVMKYAFIRADDVVQMHCFELEDERGLSISTVQDVPNPLMFYTFGNNSFNVIIRIP